MSDTVPLTYSRLTEVLSRKDLKVSDLKIKLKETLGMKVNVKSLYRLTSSRPLQKIDTRILGAICQTCNVGIQDLLAFEKPKAVLHRISAAEQERLDALMSKNNEGRLTERERQEFDSLAEKAHRLTMANARTLLAHRRHIAAPTDNPVRARRLQGAAPMKAGERVPSRRRTVGRGQR